ncbi:MAG TPA: 2-dehydropantoate 2-reductase [Solirubrobacteraceae bacterium]|nr:2-dehydropantoate 2-reductase [Solirubrobacteraceae bacterium]
MRSVAVLGPGGVGGLVAGALDRAGIDVTVVAREDTAERIARDGLRIHSVRLGDFAAWPRTTARLDHDVDLLVVATKAQGLTAALERIIGTPRLVVPLLNGLDHLAVLRERWPGRVCAATIRVASDRPSAGVIEHTSAGLRIDMAPATDDVQAAAHLLRGAELPTKVGDSEADVMWGKLVRINALACTTTAFDATLGAIRAHPRQRVALEGCVRETVAAAQAEGATIAAGPVLTEIDKVEPDFTSSMHRDVAEGREPELDAIPGAVLRAAARHGIPCPTIESLVAAIRLRLS